MPSPVSSISEPSQLSQVLVMVTRPLAFMTLSSHLLNCAFVFPGFSQTTSSGILEDVAASQRSLSVFIAEIFSETTFLHPGLNTPADDKIIKNEIKETK